jgi:hypothetical protein
MAAISLICSFQKRISCYAANTANAFFCFSYTWKSLKWLFSRNWPPNESETILVVDESMEGAAVPK